MCTVKLNDFSKIGGKLVRANPGSEFVVANTLTKWKKLEPNELT